MIYFHFLFKMNGPHSERVRPPVGNILPGWVFDKYAVSMHSMFDQAYNQITNHSTESVIFSKRKKLVFSKQATSWSRKLSYNLWRRNIESIVQLSSFIRRWDRKTFTSVAQSKQRAWQYIKLIELISRVDFLYTSQIFEMNLTVSICFLHQTLLLLNFCVSFFYQSLTLWFYKPLWLFPRTLFPYVLARF